MPDRDERDGRVIRVSCTVEPPEPMRGLEIPADLVDALGAGKRPRVTVTINHHSWKTRVAIMRSRYLIGLSIANRRAAGVATGDVIEAEIELDTQPAVVVEPPDLADALTADPAPRAAYDRLTHSRRRALVHAIDTAKKPETRLRRIEQTISALHAPTPEAR